MLLLAGCFTQSVKVENESSARNTRQSITFGGVSSELYEEAVKEGEKAKNKLEELERDLSLSGTAKRILAEAEEAREQGDEKQYLAKVQEYRKLLNDEPIKRAAESWELEAQVLFSQLRLKEAQQAIEKAVILDSSNSEYLLTLAGYLRWNGNYQRMEEVSLKAISLIENEELLDEYLLSNANSYLGLAYLHGGKYNLAEKHLQQSFEMDRELLGKEHPDVAQGLNNLAGLYYLQGRYEEAEPLFKQALEMRKKLLGEEHPNTQATRNNLLKLT